MSLDKLIAGLQEGAVRRPVRYGDSLDDWLLAMQFSGPGDTVPWGDPPEEEPLEADDQEVVAEVAEVAEEEPVPVEVAPVPPDPFEEFVGG